MFSRLPGGYLPPGHAVLLPRIALNTNEVSVKASFFQCVNSHVILGIHTADRAELPWISLAVLPAGVHLAKDFRAHVDRLAPPINERKRAEVRGVLDYLQIPQKVLQGHDHAGVTDFHRLLNRPDHIPRSEVDDEREEGDV